MGRKRQVVDSCASLPTGDLDPSVWQAVLQQLERAAKRNYPHFYGRRASADELHDICYDILLRLISSRIFLRLANGELRDGAEAKLRAFIRKTTRNYLLDRVRKMRERIPITADLRVVFPQDYEREILEEEIRRAACRLGPRERMLFELLFEEALEIEAIACGLNLKIESVYVLKHRILKRLREMIATDEPLDLHDASHARSAKNSAR